MSIFCSIRRLGTDAGLGRLRLHDLRHTATSHAVMPDGKLIEQTCLKQGIEPQGLTLHFDRGAPMTSKGTAQRLADLGVTRCVKPNGFLPPPHQPSPQRLGFCDSPSRGGVI